MSYFTLGGGFRAAISRKRAATPRSDVRFGSKVDVTFGSRMRSGYPTADIDAAQTDICFVPESAKMNAKIALQRDYRAA